MDKNIYINTSGIEILDGDNFVPLKGVLKNANVKDWIRLTLETGQTIEVTSDHPFMNDNGKVIASDLIVGQYLYNNDDEPIQIIKIEEISESKPSYDVETESEVEKRVLHISNTLLIIVIYTIEILNCII